MKPTIVLVHGAFAESSSWNSVIDSLAGTGHAVIAAANPLRGLATDAAAVGDLVRTVDGPVVLVAHSYGGAVISNVPADAGEITGLVYVNGFAPDPDENCFGLAGRFPGSMLGEDTSRPVPLSDGTTDLYIVQDRFQELFCADVPGPQAGRMAATQRPATQEALTEPSGERPLWRELPSWFLIGKEDRIIPATLQHYMAERAGAQRTVLIQGGSHAVAVSQPQTTADLILEAAALPVAA
jgi:pimeloyl-ACP methyl ester carboxylesterase